MHQGPQPNGREGSWAALNRLCWAIGSISGSMVEEQENRWVSRGLVVSVAGAVTWPRMWGAAVWGSSRMGALALWVGLGFLRD